MRFRITIIVAAALLAAGCASRPSTPVIGVTCYVLGNINAIDDNCINAIRKAGYIPVIVPGVNSKEEADAVVTAIDGILFTGGEDVEPSRYGEEVLNESVQFCKERDASDFLLIQAARDRNIPIMGICRGSQILNVAFGGTLWQDLPAQKGVEHRQTEPGQYTSHKAILEKGSRLRAILADADTILVNSTHHQAVKEVGPGCKVMAYSEDGIVEAWEGPGVFCVQFHPELLVCGGNDYYLPLFNVLVEKANQNPD